MEAFTYYTPTKVVFEEGAEKHLVELLKENKATNILIVYGGDSAEKSGLIERITKSIPSGNMNYFILKNVVANPLLSTVYEGIKCGKENNVDFILAIGGGSAIDTAKAIGVGLATNHDVWEYFENKRDDFSCIPVGTILTIAAAGSEMSPSCVITKDEGLLKRGIRTSEIICKFAIMDPLLTLTLPDYQTFCGIVDIMMHTMERYFNTVDNMELTDSLSEGLLRTMIKYARVLKKDSQNVEARWNVMWAGSLSHNGLMNCGNNRGDWATHKIEHEVSGLYNVTHGAGLSAIWASWARYVVEKIPHRFEKFGINVLNIPDKGNTLLNAYAAIDKMEEFYQEIDMPTSLCELKINPTEDEIKSMAQKGTNDNEFTLGTVKNLNSNDIEKILRSAL